MVENKGKDKVFNWGVYIAAGLYALITLLPLLYVLANSLSAPDMVNKGRVSLWPIGFTFSNFQKVLSSEAILRGYLNTFIYTILGTIITLVLQFTAAYPLSRRDLPCRKFWSLFYVVPMFISGGMIPTYIVVTKLGLYNSRWAIILPGLISTWNLILCRTYIMSVPEEMFDSAKVDGCTEFRFLLVILLPLIKPIIAVLIIYYGVGHWNAWFNALLYLSDVSKHPVQIYLRKLLIQSSNELAASAIELESSLQVRYCAMFVTVLPILAIYPFFQKYFTKGVMVGSLKG